MSEQLSLLVRTPTPFEDESLFGYLLRISEANGYTSLAEVAPLAKLTIKQFNSKYLPVRKLAGILGFSQESLDRYKYIETSQSLHPRIQLLGHDLSGASITRRLSINPRVCPICINNDSYISAFWDLSLALVCPRHAIFAATKCHKCNKVLSWNRSGVAICRCGADLTGAPQRKAPPAYVELMQIIKLKLERSPISALKQDSGFPLDDFEKIPLGQFLDLLFAFTSFTVNRKYSLNSDTNHVYLNVIECASNVFSDWPNGFRAFLRDDNNRHVHSDKNFWMRFKSFYRVLNKSPWFDANCNFISDELIKFGLEEMGESADGLVETSPITLTPRIGISLKYRKYEGLGKENLNHEKLSDLARLGLIFSEKKAAGYLGLPSKVFELIVDAGVLDEFLNLDPSKTPNFPWTREELDGINGAAVDLKPLHYQETSLLRYGVVLKKVMSQHNIDLDIKASIVRDVLAGELDVLDVVGDCLGGVVVDARDVANYVVNRQLNRLLTASYDDAVAQINSPQWVIDLLVHLGFLDSIMTKNKSRIVQHSLNIFTESYISEISLAKYLEIERCELISKIKELRIPSINLQDALGVKPFLFISKSFLPRFQNPH